MALARASTSAAGTRPRDANRTQAAANPPRNASPAPVVSSTATGYPGVTRRIPSTRATDPAAPRDFEDFTDASGHTLLDSREEAGVFVIVLEKRKG